MLQITLVASKAERGGSMTCHSVKRDVTSFVRLRLREQGYVVARCQSLVASLVAAFRHTSELFELCFCLVGCRSVARSVASPSARVSTAGPTLQGSAARS